MPHRVAVVCPSCRACAEFEFAEVCRIQLREDLPYFQNSDVLEYQRFQDTTGHFWNGAVYYAGLHGDPKLALHNLPAGYEPMQWAHSEYLYRNHGLDLGSIHCARCRLRAKHDLRWPDEAYFAISYRSKVLWAFDRDSATELLKYLEATHRNSANFRWRSFLLHVPTLFKTAKARQAVCKELRRLLELPRSARSNKRSQGTPASGRP
jgi:hypothetical protein